MFCGETTLFAGSTQFPYLLEWCRKMQAVPVSLLQGVWSCLCPHQAHLHGAFRPKAARTLVLMAFCVSRQ